MLRRLTHSASLCVCVCVRVWLYLQICSFSNALSSWVTITVDAVSLLLIFCLVVGCLARVNFANQTSKKSLSFFFSLSISILFCYAICICMCVCNKFFSHFNRLYVFTMYSLHLIRSDGECNLPTILCWFQSLILVSLPLFFALARFWSVLFCFLCCCYFCFIFCWVWMFNFHIYLIQIQVEISVS